MGGALLDKFEVAGAGFALFDELGVVELSIFFEFEMVK